MLLVIIAVLWVISQRLYQESIKSPMPKSSHPKVSIIGAGKVGSTLVLALYKKGYPIVSIISRKGHSALSLAKAVKCKRASTQLIDLSPDTELIIIAVTDGELPQIVKQLTKIKKIKFKKLFIMHTSGVHSTRVMEPLKKMGATVASVHPIQTFPEKQSLLHLQSKLHGIYYGINGSTKAIVKAERLVADLEGKAIEIPEDMKSLYHVACVFASGYMLTFLNVIKELSQSIHLKASWTEVFGPLMTNAMENMVKTSTSDAITGPILRGDIETIEEHLKTLSLHAPQFIPLYTVTGIEMARIAKDHNKIEQKNFIEIIFLFKKFIQSTNLKNISKVKK
jgi:predicted short-subunit dehydrogenase-like oxidoreductase (DUF2520 family)